MKSLPHTLAYTLIACLGWFASSSAQGQQADGAAALTFGVISPRSAVMTAQYWNPILRYVSQRSGVPLRLKLAKSAEDHAAMIGRGEFDFIYSNYQFTPGNDSIGYTALARPLRTSMRSQIIVPAGSAIASLEQLRDREVAFPSKVSFAGYQVPMDALQRAGITVKTKFTGTVENALSQMFSGRVAATAASVAISNSYAERNKVAYRILWSSEDYPAIPIAAHPAVPQEKVAAVRVALTGMADDPKGRAILAASASLFGGRQFTGFAAASNAEYERMHHFYKYRLDSRENH